MSASKAEVTSCLQVQVHGGVLVSVRLLQGMCEPLKVDVAVVSLSQEHHVAALLTPGFRSWSEEMGCTRQEGIYREHAF